MRNTGSDFFEAVAVVIVTGWTYFNKSEKQHDVGVIIFLWLHFSFPLHDLMLLHHLSLRAVFYNLLLLSLFSPTMTHTHTHTHTQIQHTHAGAHACKHAHTHASTLTPSNIPNHAFIHAHEHTYTHAHTCPIDVPLFIFASTPHKKRKKLYKWKRLTFS